MVTDKQFEDLQKKFEDLYRQFSKLSQDMAAIQMKLGAYKSSVQDVPTQAKKDITRYKFDGKILNKRQLVLDCIKKYINDHSEVDYKTIQEVFPDYIQGSLGVIRSVEEAELYKDAPSHYFFDDESIITLDGAHYVVCKDWTVQNIKRFIDAMTDLGYGIDIIKRS